MFRRSWLTVIVLVVSGVVYGDEPAIDLTGIDRTIHKDPVYKSTPRYALLVFGPRAEHRAWFVVDGDEVAYIDRNGNGDLTDPDERIELDRAATDKIHLASTQSVKAMHVFQIGNVAGSVLSFQLWVRNPEYNPSEDETLKDHPEIQAYQQDMRDRDWTNGSLYRVATDGMQAQIPLALSEVFGETPHSCRQIDGEPSTFSCKARERRNLVRSISWVAENQRSLLTQD